MIDLLINYISSPWWWWRIRAGPRLARPGNSSWAGPRVSPQCSNPIHSPLPSWPPVELHLFLFFCGVSIVLLASLTSPPVPAPPPVLFSLLPWPLRVCSRLPKGRRISSVSSPCAFPLLCRMPTCACPSCALFSLQLPVPAPPVLAALLCLPPCAVPVVKWALCIEAY